MIDRLRTSLQARIGTTRAHLDQDHGTGGTALTERELRGDLITAESAELSRLYDAGSIGAATRRRLQRSLDLEPPGSPKGSNKLGEGRRRCRPSAPSTSLWGFRTRPSLLTWASTALTRIS